MIIDVLIVAIIVCNIMICFKKGLAKSVFNIISAVAGAFLVVVCYRDFSDFLKKSSLGVMLDKKITGYIVKTYSDTASGAIDGADMPKLLKGVFQSGAKNFEGSVHTFADSMVSIAAAVVSVILLIIIIKIIMSIIPKLLSIAVSIPIIKQFDKLFGGVFGIVCGVVWAVVFVYLCGFLSLVPTFDIINQQLDKSFFLQAVYRII